jgi:hypothetical protein
LARVEVGSTRYEGFAAQCWIAETAGSGHGLDAAAGGRGKSRGSEWLIDEAAVILFGGRREEAVWAVGGDRCGRDGCVCPEVSLVVWLDVEVGLEVGILFA